MFIPFILLFSDITHMIGTSLHNIWMTSHITAYVATSSCVALMKSCPLWCKQMHIIRAAVPCSECVCWCVHSHHTHMMTNFDPKCIPSHPTPGTLLCLHIKPTREQIILKVYKNIINNGNVKGNKIKTVKNILKLQYKINLKTLS